VSLGSPTRTGVFRSLEDLSLSLATGAITSVTLTETFLNRIDGWNHALHAFRDLFAEDCLRQAVSRDEARKVGAVAGPLHGIPVAIKEIFDIAGWPTQAGSKALTDRRPDISAHAVKRLEEAGMVVLGRTHMVEFAFGGWGTNPVMGAPRNPWASEAHCVAGGSSSGSAVAVAAGLAPAATRAARSGRRQAGAGSSP
jgi:aspartyl-tRNA(Asn)/glutamyl-tRNA(Gln) amidotransferase subunit A